MKDEGAEYLTAYIESGSHNSHTLWSMQIWMEKVTSELL